MKWKLFAFHFELTVFDHLAVFNIPHLSTSHVCSQRAIPSGHLFERGGDTQRSLQTELPGNPEAGRRLNPPHDTVNGRGKHSNSAPRSFLAEVILCQ